mmetsp:Transcript_12039/g.38936  ORF Transcript_12039/g.38936 Transcript_12039/m.38936 type:complete len:92 (+) Transcript_12039:372-647(+)
MVAHLPHGRREHDALLSNLCHVTLQGFDAPFQSNSVRAAGQRRCGRRACFPSSGTNTYLGTALTAARTRAGDLLLLLWGTHGKGKAANQAV